MRYVKLIASPLLPIAVATLATGLLLSSAAGQGYPTPPPTPEFTRPGPPPAVAAPTPPRPLAPAPAPIDPRVVCEAAPPPTAPVQRMCAWQVQCDAKMCEERYKREHPDPRQWDQSVIRGCYGADYRARLNAC